MSILYLTCDLMFSSRASQAAREAGKNLRVVSDPTALVEAVSSGTAELVLLDLSTAGLDVRPSVAAIRAAAPVKIVAYGPHVHRARLAEAQAAGCNQVLSKGEFNSRLDDLMRGL